MSDEDLFQLVSDRIRHAVKEIREIAVEQLGEKSMDDLTAGRLATVAYQLENTGDLITKRLERNDE
jgi:hypothetical protein